MGELFEPGAKPSLFTQSALLGSFRCATIRFFFFESVWKSLIRFIQVLLELVGPCLTDSVSAHPYLGILILAVCTLRHSRKHNCNSFDQMGVWGREGEGGQYLDVSWFKAIVVVLLKAIGHRHGGNATQKQNKTWYLLGSLGWRYLSKSIFPLRFWGTWLQGLRNIPFWILLFACCHWYPIFATWPLPSKARKHYCDQ